MKIVLNFLRFLLVMLPLMGWSKSGIYEFVDLYPDCVDNESSKIYEPKEWSKELNTPVFPGGGDLEFMRYIYEKVERNYPDVVDSTTKSEDPSVPDKIWRAKGVVQVHITVDRCGKAVNPVIVEGVNEEYDKVALKICDELPIFKPGAINGVRVKVGMIIPFNFKRERLPIKPSWADDGGGYDGGGDSGSDDGGSSDWGGGWGGDPW